MTTQELFKMLNKKNNNPKIVSNIKLSNLLHRARRSDYSPNCTLKNWLVAPDGGVTSSVVLTALFFSFTSTPLDIASAESSPSSVSAA